MKPLQGKLLVGQSGGCTQVINASLAGVIEQAASTDAITGVLGARHGVEGILAGDVIDLSRVDRATLKSLTRTPAAALGSCRRKVTDEDAARVVAFLADNEIRYFVYIGGNDSADTTQRVLRAADAASYELRVMAVPKTIDNDLPDTDHCPGYGSAARFMAWATVDAGRDTEAMKTLEPVKIIEVMGRNAGWLAAASALGKRDERDAPQFIWPPEIPFDEAKFLRLVRRHLRRIGFAVVVVAETLRDKTGRPVAARGKRVARDPFGHPRVGDVAEYLCALVADECGVRARWDKPGTIQRMSALHISPVDAREARGAGAWAVRYAAQGQTGQMVTLIRKPGARYACAFGTTPLERVVNKERPMPRGFWDARSMMPTQQFMDYARPLAGRLPAHARL